MIVTLSKWGNSLATRIPKEALDDLNLREGDRLELVAEDRRLVLTPAFPLPRLGELIAAVTPQNRHALCDDSGTDVW